MAINGCDDVTKLIHHSDRGVQYCSNDYVKILKKNKIKISMTENGDPLENAIAERVNGILKDELLEDKFGSYQIAQNDVAVAVSIYNYERPHSSIEFLTPVEAHQKTGTLKRKWKNYYQQKENTTA